MASKKKRTLLSFLKRVYEANSLSRSKREEHIESMKILESWINDLNNNIPIEKWNIQDFHDRLYILHQLARPWMLCISFREFQRTLTLEKLKQHSEVKAEVDFWFSHLLASRKPDC